MRQGPSALRANGYTTQHASLLAPKRLQALITQHPKFQVPNPTILRPQPHHTRPGAAVAAARGAYTARGSTPTVIHASTPSAACAPSQTYSNTGSIDADSSCMMRSSRLGVRCWVLLVYGGVSSMASVRAWSKKT
jgi:hypothetical protein